MMNDQARELIDPADQAALIAGADRGAARPSSRLTLVDLPSGAVARVHGRPELDRAAAPPAACCTCSWPRATSRRAPRRRARPAGHAARRGRVRAAVDQVLPGRRPALPATASGWCWRASRAPARPPSPGPPTRCARPAAHLRVLDADDYGPRWIAEIIEELETGRRHAGARPRRPAVRRRAAGAGRRAGAAPRVHRPGAAVGGGHGRPGGLVGDGPAPSCSSCFPRTVDGAAAAPPRRGRRRAGAAPDRPADPRLAS